MLIYILVTILTLFMAYFSIQLKGKLQNVAIIISAIPSSVVAAARYEIGPDYHLYQNIFDSIRLTGSFFSVKSLEWGYVLLNKAIGLFDGDYQILLFVVAMLITSFFFFGMKKMSDSYVLSVALFFVLGTFFDSLNGLRQYMAAAITFYAIAGIFSKKPIRFILLVLAASLFHSSALPALVIYPLVRKVQLSRRSLLLLTAAFLMLGNTLGAGVTAFLSYTRYSYYLHSSEYMVEPTLGATVSTCVATLLALFVGVYKGKGSDAHTAETVRRHEMGVLNFLALLSALLSFFVPLALRVQYYFIPFESVFIPYALHMIENTRLRFLVGLLIVGLLGSMTVIGMVSNGWYGAYPYRAVWEMIP